MVCAGDRALAPTPQAPGYNPYVGVVGDVTDDLPPDPRRGLRQVFLPTILLRGECDFVDWGVVGQYWEAVPNIQAYYVADAGSMLHLSQPELVKALIFAFVSEQRLPLDPLSERAIWSGPPTIGAP
jgi:proline iminopeptidase